MQKNSFQELTPWKESLVRMNENQFLSTVKLYLGIIKTPYNKERLINDLISFLCKDIHKKRIVSLLSENDILFLSAISYLEKAGRDTLLSFFDGVFSVFYLYEYLTNLEERLLVYRHYDEKTRQEHFAINPIIEKEIGPYINLSVLLPLSTKKIKKERKAESIYPSSSLLGSWYAFVSQNPEICKNDGKLKKKIQAAAQISFPRVKDVYLEALNKALINLSLFYIDGPNVYSNEKKWKEFGSLSEWLQQIYVCVSSFSPFSKETLIKHVKFTKTFLTNIPPQGYTKTVLLRLAFLLHFIHKADGENKKKGYFSALVQKAQGTQMEDPFTHELLIEKLHFFGLLKIEGKNENGEEVYVVSKQQGQSEKEIIQEEQAQTSPLISIDAGFSVTFINKTNLANMVSLVSCMNLISFDTVCRFEITRNSCMRVFDTGEKSEALLEKLEKATGKNVSQNLSFSLKEWYDTYCSASLYHGYVLQVSKEKIIQIENNPILAPYIKKVLAKGIFLLDFVNTEEAQLVIEKSGLDFIGSPKRTKKEQERLTFTEIEASKTLDIFYDNKTASSLMSTEEHFKKMKDYLDDMSMSEEQREGLLERIYRKLIISEQQLVGETIRSEKTEASGIDFIGKIQVVEQAISSLNMVEVEGSKTVFIGRPLKIEKRDGDARLTLSKEDGTTIVLSIGQARKIKRFRPPLFFEEK